MNNRNQGMRNEDRNDDRPPYSRLFVVCSKHLRHDDLRVAFDSFGYIEDIHMPKDRNTGEYKGIAYVKYSKTSSAALAIKEMHLKTIQDKIVKVMVASYKNDSHSNRNTNDDKYTRLFIKVNKQTTESEIKEYFSEFGDVDSIHLQRDKLTSECRGFAYVNYKSFLDAAKAYEECDKKYKAIFATPKDELKRSRNSVENFVDNFRSSIPSITGDNYSDHYNQPRENSTNNIHRRDDISPLINSKPEGYDSISVTCSPQIPQKYIERLFNIIPGMTQFKYTSDSYNGYCKVLVTYESEKSASYAVERLNNFEFPSGEIISVKPDDNPITKAANNLKNMIVNNFLNCGDASNPGLLQLADVISQASNLLKAATASKEVKSDNSLDGYCSVRLPPPQPLANTNSRVAQRCFIVFKPHPLPLSILNDVFCRFGDLIGVSTFPNKTFGYAKYASVKSAQEAIKTLHGATLYDVTLKVLEADERIPKDDKMNVDDEWSVDRDTDRKRMKLHDEDSVSEWVD